ncbi:hypothetical protein F5Y04DRAFT_246849 [Hypomontagnella monticulosa]|nr:hypothetical protein F5Y04DRAFT_246849 [Hypomontagnella monticulosa]
MNLPYNVRESRCRRILLCQPTHKFPIVSLVYCILSLIYFRMSVIKSNQLASWILFLFVLAVRSQINCKHDDCYNALFPCASPLAIAEALDYCSTIGHYGATNYPAQATDACGNTNKRAYISACFCGAACPSLPSTTTSSTNITSASITATTSTTMSGSGAQSSSSSITVVTLTSSITTFTTFNSTISSTPQPSFSNSSTLSLSTTVTANGTGGAGDPASGSQTTTSGLGSSLTSSITGPISTESPTSTSSVSNNSSSISSNSSISLSTISSGLSSGSSSILLSTFTSSSSGTATSSSGSVSGSSVFWPNSTSVSVTSSTSLANSSTASSILANSTTSSVSSTSLFSNSSTVSLTTSSLLSSSSSDPTSTGTISGSETISMDTTCSPTSTPTPTSTPCWGESYSYSNATAFDPSTSSTEGRMTTLIQSMPSSTSTSSANPTCTTVSSDNTVENGDFESGLSPWSIDLVDFLSTTYSISNPGADGSCSAFHVSMRRNMQTDDLRSNLRLVSPLISPPQPQGSQWAVSFWVRFDSGAQVGDSYLNVFANGIEAHRVDGTDPGLTNWTHVEFPYSAAWGDHVLQLVFSFVLGDAPMNEVWIDKIGLDVAPSTASTSGPLLPLPTS